MALALALSGCQGDPAAAVAQLEAALQHGNRSELLGLVTRASRPVVAAAWAAGGPMLAVVPPKVPVAVVGVQRGEASAVVTVRAGAGAGAVQREWVLVPEDGRWRLDLMATSSRRPWGAP
jgi:hypothetical protein